MTTVAHVTMPRGVNLNTIVTVIGFLGLFATIVTGWTNLQANQRNFGRFIEEQKTWNGKSEERSRNNSEAISKLPILAGDVARLESAADKINGAQDQRIDRISDSISDVRSGVADIKTQLALVKQSLDRVEAWQNEVTSRLNGPSRVPR